MTPVVDTNPFARTALGWLKGRARSLDVYREEGNFVGGTGYLTGRFIRAPTAIMFLQRLKTKNGAHLRAGEQSADTQTAYRVAAFQTFLSGRI